MKTAERNEDIDSLIGHASGTEQASIAGAWVAMFSDHAPRTNGEAEEGWRQLLQQESDASGRRMWVSSSPEGRGPISAEYGSAVVLFDGMLHNRKELSGALATSGALAANEAELVLQSYLRWGESGLRRIKGTFAVIVWDRAHDLIFGVRDPLGVYPLFYVESGRNLWFSTSIDKLVRQPGVPRSLNRAALADHLCHRWPKQEETFYLAIKRVPPGNILELHSTERQVSRYWDPAPGGAVDRWLGEDELYRFDDLLDQAVRRCLDLGPASIFLSGGLDSVSVAAVAAQISQERNLPQPQALSLVFPDPQCNEEDVQKSVAASLGLPQMLVPLEEAVGEAGLLSTALELTGKWPAPLLNFWLPGYQAIGAVGKERGCKVTLTGSGGDEWLTVTPFLAADQLRKFDLRGIYRLYKSSQRSYQFSRRAMIKNIFWTFGARPLLAEAVRGIGTRFASRLYRRYRRGRITQSIPSWVAPDPPLRREIVRRAEVSEKEPRTRSFYERECRRGLEHPLVSMEMEEIFESGNRIGIRQLHPYMDADLVTFLYWVHPSLLDKGGRSKGLVRQSMAERFPQLGFERQKKVISTNLFQTMMLTEGPQAWRSMGGPTALAELGVVDLADIEAYAQEMFSGARPYELYRIWDILNLEAWLRSRLRIDPLK